MSEKTIRSPTSFLSLLSGASATGIKGIAAAMVILAGSPFYGPSPAAAHTQQYYTTQICTGTNKNGIPPGHIRFESGLAVNRHDDNTYILRCPIPFIRNTNNLRPIRVRVRAFDRHSQKSVLMRICEVRESELPVEGIHVPGPCPISAQDRSGVGFAGGAVLLEATLEPSRETRWVHLEIHIPDRDAQTGLSFVVGYRVCRGNC